LPAGRLGNPKSGLLKGEKVGQTGTKTWWEKDGIFSNVTRSEKRPPWLKRPAPPGVKRNTKDPHKREKGRG